MLKLSAMFTFPLIILPLSYSHGPFRICTIFPLSRNDTSVTCTGVKPSRVTHSVTYSGTNRDERCFTSRKDKPLYQRRYKSRLPQQGCRRNMYTYTPFPVHKNNWKKGSCWRCLPSHSALVPFGEQLSFSP